MLKSSSRLRVSSLAAFVALAVVVSCGVMCPDRAAAVGRVQTITGNIGSQCRCQVTQTSFSEFSSWTVNGLEANVTSSGTFTTQQLQVQRLGFALHPDSTVQGIALEICRWANADTSATTSDKFVALRSGGTDFRDQCSRPASFCVAQFTDRSPCNTESTFGGNTDLMSATNLTVAQVNDDDFGFVYQGVQTLLGNSRPGSIHLVNFTISAYFDVPTCTLPIGFGRNIESGVLLPCQAGTALDSRANCSVQCASGYTRANGTSYYACTGYTLTPASLVCVPLRCPLPGNLGIGFNSTECLFGNELASNSSCSVACSEGYISSNGTTSYVCTLGNFSSQPTLSCAPSNCTLPSNFSSVNTNYVSGTCFEGRVLAHGASCSVQCAPGLVPSPSAGGGTTSTLEFTCDLGTLRNPTMACVGSGAVSGGAAVSSFESPEGTFQFVVIGAVVGGVLLLCAVAGFVCFLRQRKSGGLDRSSSVSLSSKEVDINSSNYARTPDHVGAPSDYAKTPSSVSADSQYAKTPSTYEDHYAKTPSTDSQYAKTPTEVVSSSDAHYAKTPGSSPDR